MRILAFQLGIRALTLSRPWIVLCEYGIIGALAALPGAKLVLRAGLGAACGSSHRRRHERVELV
jgi:hypothetical protein